MDDVIKLIEKITKEKDKNVKVEIKKVTKDGLEDVTLDQLKKDINGMKEDKKENGILNLKNLEAKLKEHLIDEELDKDLPIHDILNRHNEVNNISYKLFKDKIGVEGLIDTIILDYLLTAKIILRKDKVDNKKDVILYQLKSLHDFIEKEL